MKDYKNFYTVISLPGNPKHEIFSVENSGADCGISNEVGSSVPLIPNSLIFGKPLPAARKNSRTAGAISWS